MITKACSRGIEIVWNKENVEYVKLSDMNCNLQST